MNSLTLTKYVFGFSEKSEELDSLLKRKIYSEMIPFHQAFDNARNTYVHYTIPPTNCECASSSHRAEASLTAKSTGCTGNYSLMRLPSHNCLLQTVPDAMHAVKDDTEKILYLIIG